LSLIEECVTHIFYISCVPAIDSNTLIRVLARRRRYVDTIIDQILEGTAGCIHYWTFVNWSRTIIVTIRRRLEVTIFASINTTVFLIIIVIDPCIHSNRRRIGKFGMFFLCNRKDRTWDIRNAASSSRSSSSSSNIPI
jgi:hypothetical protein